MSNVDEQQPNNNKQTEGQYRVGTEFNPSGNLDVDGVKAMSAELIDKMAEISESGMEGAREAAVAMTHYETAAMWAVKAVTKRPRYG